MAEAHDHADPPGGAALYIKQVAAMTGVPAATLRRWEREGLIAPGRTATGYRIYSYADIERCRRIRDLSAEGHRSPAVIGRALAAEAGAPPAAPDGAERLGGRLRRLRLQRGVSLRDLAAETGLSASHISSLERDLSRPSVAALHRLTAALGTRLVELLGDEADEDGSPVVPRDRRRRVNMGTPGVELEQLTVKEDMLEPSLMRIAPGAGSAEAYAHEGEEFVYVLEGAFRITLDATEHELGPGDAITFRSHRPHSWRNPGEADCVLIWVNTPPTF